MKDHCQVHRRDFGLCPFQCLLDSFDGHVVFAWLPTRLHNIGGWWVTGFAWLRPVLKRRAIGFPQWYYTELTTGGGEDRV